MARERIITLRHLSAESKALSLQPQTTKNRSHKGYPSSETEEDDGTAVDYRSLLGSASDCHSPLMEQGGAELATDCHTASQDHPYQGLEGEEEEDEDEHQNATLMMAHTVAPSSTSRLQNPLLSPPLAIQVIDTQGLSSSLDLFSHSLDMGKFMDQVTKISNGIDSIEIDLNEHQNNFQKEQSFRFKLYQKMEQDIIPNLVQLQTNISLSNLEINSSSHSLPQQQQQIENPLKREQINLLASKLNSIIYRLINQLNSEKRMIGNEIKYEWNKELSRCSMSNKRSRSQTPTRSSSAEGVTESDSPTTRDNVYDQEMDNNNDDNNQTLFKLMGLDENGQVNQKSNSEEIHKCLNLAVRSSTSYPQARKSSLIILSEFDQLQQIQTELEQLNLLIQLLSKNSLHRPHSIDHGCDGDDSSSASFSLDEGQDQETTTAYDQKEVNNERVGEKDNLKRKETYKKIQFHYHSHRDSNPSNTTTNINKSEEEEQDESVKFNYRKSKVEHDLENNVITTYRYSDLSHHHDSDHRQFPSIVLRWLSEYRFSLFISALISLLLACAATGLYFVVRSHDN